MNNNLIIDVIGVSIYCDYVERNRGTNNVVCLLEGGTPIAVVEYNKIYNIRDFDSNKYSLEGYYNETTLVKDGELK